MRSGAWRAFARSISQVDEYQSVESNGVYSGTDNENKKKSKRGMQEILKSDETDKRPLMCVKFLLESFQHSWNTVPPIPSSDTSPYTPENLSHDAEITNEEIPPVSDLQGFSWQADWDVRSGTSPCTVHLYTRIQDNSYFLGHRQYMGNKQKISSINGQYSITLIGAKLCVSSNDRVLYYITDHDKKNEETHRDTDDSYLAIKQGQLCIFQGEAPFFGGSPEDSGHREILYCPPEFAYIRKADDKNAEIAPHSYRVDDLSHQDFYEKLYFHINNDGLFGLFLGTHHPTDIFISHEERAKTLYF